METRVALFLHVVFALYSEIPYWSILLIFRLDDVQSRLKETSDEFETVRKKARKAKMDYETIQKER